VDGWVLAFTVGLSLITGGVRGGSSSPKFGRRY
jgi:hypothetical protein